MGSAGPVEGMRSASLGAVKVVTWHEWAKKEVMFKQEPQFLSIGCYFFENSAMAGIYLSVGIWQEIISMQGQIELA